jgi:2,4-diketo-3-deoxy-L-fuconate hydrolase
MDLAAGYCIGLDMTMRGSEERSLRKSLDTFTVLGPWMVTADEFAEHLPTQLTLRVATHKTISSVLQRSCFQCDRSRPS